MYIVHDRFLTVRQPKSGNAEGLFGCFKNARSHRSLANWEDKLVAIGFGCDGTSVKLIKTERRTCLGIDRLDSTTDCCRCTSTLKVGC